MLSEPYNFTEDDVDKNRNDLEDNVHEYEEGGLCVLNVNDKIKKYRVNKILGEGSYSSVWEISLNEKNYFIK